MALYPSTTLYPGPNVFPGQGEEVAPTVRVRERPPVRVHLTGVTPGGREFRWGRDDRDPANVPSALQWSDTMPGGFDRLTCTLPRKPGLDYGDLVPLSTLTVRGAGAESLGEYRLERAPRVSGEQMSVTPEAKGWQAHLEDDRSVSMPYIDRDLSRWTGPGAQRRLNLINSGQPHQNDASQAWDGSAAALALSVSGAWPASPRPVCEAWYDAGAGNTIGGIFAIFDGWADGAFALYVRVASDPVVSAEESSGDIYTASSGAVDFAPTARHRYGVLDWLYTAAGGADGTTFQVSLRALYVKGSHNLPLRFGATTYPETAFSAGYLASDIVAHAVGRWAPLLRFSTGANGTIQPSSFVIPQAAFHDRTTVASIIDATGRYEMPDWAVWDEREFHYHARGARGRRWKARVAPSGLRETGPQIDRVWNGILVAYQDPDGSVRTVGPPGSGADFQDARLLDTDPTNPANQIPNLRRWDLLLMGEVSTPEGGVRTGQQFLRESRLLDTAGQMRFVGWVEDDRGVLWPYHAVRSGDTVEAVDAADPSPRRIVQTAKDDDARTCTVDLDSPPGGLAALLARMGVALVPLGL